MATGGLPRAFELDEVLTEEEIDHAHRLYKKGKRKFYEACREQIVDPAWDRIVAVLGPCSKMYVAYGIEYRCLHKRKTRKKSINPLSPYLRKPRGRVKQEKDRSTWTETLFSSL